VIFRGAPILAAMAAILAAPGAQQSSADELLAHAREAFFQQGARTVLPDFERALALYQKAGNRRGEAMALGYIGYSYYDLGDFPKALVHLQQALKMKRALGDRQEEGKTLGHLGLVYWEMGNYNQAIREHTQSLAIARQIRDQDVDLTDTHSASFVLKSSDATANLPGFAEGNGEDVASIGTLRGSSCSTRVMRR